MIRKWYSGTAVELAKMTDVTDDMIREKSSGEITKDYLAIDENDDVHEVEDKTGTILDSAIFGEDWETTKDIERLGHIELPVPVVNIQYVRGRSPELPRLLGMTLNDFERVLYCASYVNVNDNWSEKVPLYSMNERTKYLEDHQDADISDFILSTEAIEKIMISKHVPVAKYILHTVPVMPLCMRFIAYTDKDGKKAQGPTDLNYFAEDIFRRAKRVKRLLAIKAPEIIILNEKRVMQEKIDAYISNGLRGCPYVKNNECPMDSLDELYTAVTTCTKHPVLDLNLYERVDFSDIEKKVIEKQKESVAIDEKYQKMFEEKEDNEPIVMDKADSNRQDEIEKEIHTLLYPMREKILKKSFHQYELEKETEVMSYMSDRIEREILLVWKPETCSLFNALLMPLYYNYLLYFEKQYCFDA